MADFIPTSEQQAAIVHEGNMVITACPGSGKTTVVVEKIRRKLPKLKPYQGVIGITFTVKASEELKSRCKKNAFDIKQSFFGTIDSFCLKEIIFPFISRVWGSSEHELKPIFLNEISETEKSVFEGYDWSTTSFSDYEGELIRHYQSGRILMSATSLIAGHILDNSAACRRYLLSRYRSIYVDEYQDSSEPQHQLFKKLVQLGMAGIAVGDEDQSIYGFRGGSKEYIEELKADSNFLTFSILTNHRCHPSISNYARRLYDPQCPITTTEETRVYRGSYFGSQVDLAARLCSWLPNVRERFGVENNSDIAVLVKSNASLDRVSEGMSVPHRVFKDNLLTDISSEYAKLCTKLLSYRFDKQLTAESVLSEALSQKLSKSEQARLRRAIKHIKDCHWEQVFDAISTVCTGLFSSALPANVSEALMQVLGNDDLLKSFHPINQDEIQVMTLHKSKGLEFDVVFHLDLYKWVFPYARSQSYNSPLLYPSWDQEMNLHYVGITRAKEACILLTSGARINGFNERKLGQPSDFLELEGLEGLYTNLSV